VLRYRFSLEQQAGRLMRIRKTSKGLAVQAVAGTSVILLGLDMKKSDCNGLMGFAVHRTDHTENKAGWLCGMKTFEATDPGLPSTARYPTNEHPIQGFSWSDFAVKADHRYTYVVQALRGTPDNLQPFKEVTLDVRAESEFDGKHDIFFNRGAAASQEYARRFDNVPPNPANPLDPRWAWLSRHVMEAIVAFTGRALDSRWGLRVAAYEFRLPRFAQALREAHLRGADVKVLYDANDYPPDEHGNVFPRDENRATVDAANIKGLSDERITRDDVKQPPIAHHKFIVLLKDGKAQAVLTGSTNFSLGGVFGQSNVVHCVDDPKVAKAYLDCWTLIAGNPEHTDLRGELSQRHAVPAQLPPKGTTVLFSPRQTSETLEWYAARAKNAPGALFMTFAFGMNALFQDAYRNGSASLRYALLDKLIPSGVRKEARPAAEAAMRALRSMPENRFAVGNLITVNGFDRWVKEQLTGLNSHVRFVHTKFMLADPLGPDPLIITGSANFSEASTTANDENMLLIRGNKRVADMYLGEYMRLWNHYAFREWAARQPKPSQAKFRFLDDRSQWWQGYFGDTDRSRQRRYFSGAS
jgi:phosphatidylserine/phosphatidylglycerophosphate/cardiolipin synthase-like enzyme